MQKSKYYTIDREAGRYTLTIKNTNIPLFRYRTFNEYSLSDLINDELSFTTPNNFNDPYDCSFAYDKNIGKKIKKLVLEQKGVSLTEEQIEMFFKVIAPIIKQSNGIACFSEDINNEIMWAHYANCGKGFALGYSYNDLKKLSTGYENSQRQSYQTAINTDIQTELPLVRVGPVVYNNRKYDISGALLNVIKYILINKNLSNEEIIVGYLKSQSQEQLKAINETILYSKNKDWQYEKEWRVVASMPNYECYSGYFSLSGIRAERIFLGEFIDRTIETLLRKTASEKGIAVFKMYTVITKSGCKLSYK